jgi:hypothetical protein
MVNYKLIRATINEAEFLSHGSSEAQVDAGQSLTPFFLSSGGSAECRWTCPLGVRLPLDYVYKSLSN